MNSISQNIEILKRFFGIRKEKRKGNKNPVSKYRRKQTFDPSRRNFFGQMGKAAIAVPAIGKVSEELLKDRNIAEVLEEEVEEQIVEGTNLRIETIGSCVQNGSLAVYDSPYNSFAYGTVAFVSV